MFGHFDYVLLMQNVKNAKVAPDWYMISMAYLQTNNNKTSRTSWVFVSTILPRLASAGSWRHTV